jgi:hypothetical protein
MPGALHRLGGVRAARPTGAARADPRRSGVARAGIPAGSDLGEGPVRAFGEWAGEDWDNWRGRIFQPAATAVGLPDDTIPRDLRGSFASLLHLRGLQRA